MINERTRVSETVVAVLTKPNDSEIKRDIVGWKAWYDNGAVYSSDKHKWEDLPVTGLQVLKKFYYQGEELKTEVQSGPDAYLVDDKLIDDRLPDYIKLGTYIDNNQYHKLYNEAVEDREKVNKRI